MGTLPKVLQSFVIKLHVEYWVENGEHHSCHRLKQVGVILKCCFIVYTMCSDSAYYLTSNGWSLCVWSLNDGGNPNPSSVVTEALPPRVGI